jgi:hypothetical protein
MRIFKKYEFQSQKIAEQRIEALNEESHRHAIVKLGYLWIEQPVYDEEGNIVEAGVQSENYSVDVLWYRSELLDEEGEIDYPYGWVSKEVNYDDSWVSQNGAHTFAGWNFNN